MIGLGRAYSNLAWVLTCAGQMEKAQEANRTAVRVHDRVVRENSTNPSFRYRLSISLENFGTVYFYSGKPTDARDSYWRSLEFCDALARENPRVPEFLERVILAYIGFGHALIYTGENAEARASFEKALELAKKLPDAPATSVYFSLASAHYGLGKLHRKQGQTADAVKSLRRTLEVGEANNPGGEKPFVTYQLACANALCSAIIGSSKTALSPAEQAEVQKLSDRAVEILRQAISEGWRNVSWMDKDQDLDVLRDRADFRKLLGDLRGGLVDR